MAHERRHLLLGITAVACLFAAALVGPGITQAGAAETVIQVPGSNTTLTLWEEAAPSGAVPYYSIAVDGRAVRTAPADYRLGLRYASFDPLEGEPTVPSILEASRESRLYLVQFVTPPIELFADQIAQAGGAVRHYVAQNAYIVEMGAQARAAVEALPYVRWVGAFHPAYRLEEFMLENLENAGQIYPLRRYNLQVLDTAHKSVVADRLSAMGAQVDNRDAGKFLVEATLTPAELFAAVQWDEVLFVDRWSPYETDMNNVRALTGADYIEGAAGYTGTGVRGEVFDAGFNMTHHDFESRPLIPHGSIGSDSHGASTSGIVFGDGAGQGIARGMLPDGQGIVADYSDIGLTGPNRYTNSMELLGDPFYAVFQTSSVGSDRTAQYNTISADTDAMLFDSDLAHCQSQSNAGNQQSRPQAWAKNMISVGGVYHYDTSDTGDDCWCAGASIGPASDGRIKPDLCHFYDRTYTTTCCGYESYTTSFGGTSGATPIVAGHVGLFFQMWNDGIFGNGVNPEWTVFQNRPHSSTTKAMLINTAWQYTFSGTGHDKTRTHQGWGMPNVQNLYDMREKIFVHNESTLLRPFGVEQHVLTVDPDEPALKVTMVYPDLPGNPSVQSQHRINDLTLRVVSPSGTEYYGNNGLLANMWSTPGGSADTKNTVECVFVENPEPGEWTLEIRADEIIQDAERGTIGLDSPYALVASGVRTIDASDVDGDLRPGAALGLVLDGPNPASRTAHLSYSLASDAQVRLEVYDAQGRRVATLLDERVAAGVHRTAWDGRDETGTQVQSGVYFARLSVDGAAVTQKLVIVR